MIVTIIICGSPVDVEQPSLLDQRDQDDWPIDFLYGPH